LNGYRAAQALFIRARPRTTLKGSEKFLRIAMGEGRQREYRTRGLEVTYDGRRNKKDRNSFQSGWDRNAKRELAKSAARREP